jgi:hypothetical protein
MLPGRQQWDIDVVSGRPTARIRASQAGTAGAGEASGALGTIKPQADAGRAPAAWPRPRARAAVPRQARADGPSRYLKLTGNTL